MAKRPVPPTATEKEVRALLERYHCPVPFHEVRTRFLFVSERDPEYPLPDQGRDLVLDQFRTPPIVKILVA